MTDQGQVLDPKRVPRHLAIIMDGNGRWAKERGKDRVYGHHEGVISVREAVSGAAEFGVSYLTLYAFSTENWNRPASEVEALMELLVNTIRKEVDELQKNKVRLRVIGDIASLPLTCQNELAEAIEMTKENDGLTLILALSYSARQEIARACRQIAKKVERGQLKADEIQESIVEQHLYTSEFPDPELMIRTSGEHRISNFLLYQLAYAELYFSPVHWPEFRKEHLLAALIDYQNRERRFGKTSEQIQKNA